MTRNSRGLDLRIEGPSDRAPRRRLGLVLVAALAVSVTAACTGPQAPKSAAQADSDLPAGVERRDLTPVEGFTMVTTTPDDNASRYEAARVISEAWTDL